MNHRTLTCPSIVAVLLMSLAVPLQLNAQEASAHEVMQTNRRVEEQQQLKAN